MFPNYLSHPHDGTIAAHVREFDTHRGHILAVWAGIESSVDHANHYGWLYSDRKISEKVPVGLSEKLKLFGKIHRLEPLAPLKEQAEPLLERMNRLYEDRHWMAHGALIPAESDPEGWTLLKNEFPRKVGGLIAHWRRFTHDDMFALGSEVRDLAGQLVGYLEALRCQIARYPLDEAPR